MIIGIDFDGSVVTHEFPGLGKDIGAVPVLKKLVEAGHQLILFTMRSDVQNPTSNDPMIINLSGEYLTDAVNWFKKHNIPLFGINENPEQKSWTTSPKPYCNLYIDDAGLGMPLKRDSELTPGPFVDWIEVEKLLIKKKYIK